MKLYTLQTETCIVKVSYLLGKLSAMREHNLCTKLSLHKLEGTRRVDRRAVRWLDTAEANLNTLGVRI
jgi:hypothetical protein